MNVILSIKPKFVEPIVDGKKRYEFRKKTFSKEIEKIYLYSSSPINRIIGCFSVGKIIENHPQRLWQKLNKESGVSKDEFFEYFQGNETGYAIEILDFKQFKRPIDPSKMIDGFMPPQSFCYLDGPLKMK